MTTTTSTEPPESAALTLESATMLRFPPFPEPPDGVTLTPFTAFRPSGIRVPIDDDDNFFRAGQQQQVELDGLGIPTIALRVKHLADTSEKKKKRKKKSGAAQSVQVAPERPKMWWEVWEELEDLSRRNVYNESVCVSALQHLCALIPSPPNRNETPIDRLCQASEDFKNGRTWPPVQHGVQNVWDIVSCTYPARPDLMSSP